MVCKHENGLQVINVLALVNSHFVLIFSTSTTTYLKIMKKLCSLTCETTKHISDKTFPKETKNHVNVTLKYLITVH